MVQFQTLEVVLSTTYPKIPKNYSGTLGSDLYIPISVNSTNASKLLLRLFALILSFALLPQHLLSDHGTALKTQSTNKISYHLTIFNNQFPYLIIPQTTFNNHFPNLIIPRAKSFHLSITINSNHTILRNFIFHMVTPLLLFQPTPLEVPHLSCTTSVKDVSFLFLYSSPFLFFEYKTHSHERLPFIQHHHPFVIRDVLLFIHLWVSRPSCHRRQFFIQGIKTLTS